jgi:hypothetical protein
MDLIATERDRATSVMLDRWGRKWRREMHPEDLMKPDLFSGIVLLGSGGLIFISLLLIVVTALTRA